MQKKYSNNFHRIQWKGRHLSTEFSENCSSIFLHNPATKQTNVDENITLAEVITQNTHKMALSASACIMNCTDC